MSEYVSQAWGAPSGLTDFERECLAFSTMVAVGATEGINLDDAAELLEAAAADGECLMEGDRHHVAVVVYGCVVLDVTRVRLRALAHPGSN